jgi:type I restriction enzyme S subunit
MSFPRYQRYKDSGVEWLGQVPEHWDVMRLKHCARLVTSKADERTNPVALENIEGWTGRLLPSEGDYQGEGTAFAAGDILFGKLRPYLAKVHLASQPGKAVGDFHVLRPRVGFDGYFAQYHMLTREFIGIVDGSTYGSKMPRASWEFVGGMPMAVPPPVEQPAIAAFLDRETAKIDALIAEQQRLIELLQEKRQSVISHAVTKGLNPDASMKDSGIEWLGQVPEHWEVAPLRRLDCLVQTGPFGTQLHAHEYVCGGTPVVNPTHMVDGCIVPTEDITVTSDVVARLPHQRLIRGDVVFSRRGELGRCALVTEREEGWLCGTGSMILRLRGAMYASEYLSLFLSLDALRQYFESFSVGSVMDSLSAGTLLSMPVIVPPIAEQRACAIYAAEQSTLIDSLKESASAAITLLQERRSALISATVTGQIDVRGLTGAEAA